MIFKIPVTWSVYGCYFVEADTLKEAIHNVNSSDPPCDSLPKGRYIDDSIEINMEVLREEYPEYFEKDKWYIHGDKYKLKE